MSFWRKLFGRTPSVSISQPRRRVKTYSAESGYVYTYWFLGFLRIGRPRSGFRYEFQVSAGSSLQKMIPVFLGESVLATWESSHRALSASERFGIAKIALRNALDATPALSELSDVAPAEEEIARIAETLDL